MVLIIFLDTGHEIQEMLQECSFLGKKCGPQ